MTKNLQLYDSNGESSNVNLKIIEEQNSEN